MNEQVLSRVFLKKNENNFYGSKRLDSVNYSSGKLAIGLRLNKPSVERREFTGTKPLDLSFHRPIASR